MGKLEGKVAVLTAATSGMALAAAKLFAWEGAFVFITARDQIRMDQALKQIDGQAEGIIADSSVLSDLDRLFETVQAKSRRSVRKRGNVNLRSDRQDHGRRL